MNEELASYPVRFSVNYPERHLSRLTTFLRIFTAILDRLLHHCEVITVNGPSYRLKDRIRGRKGVMGRGAREEQGFRHDSPFLKRHHCLTPIQWSWTT